jgi:hypothetical protein
MAPTLGCGRRDIKAEDLLCIGALVGSCGTETACQAASDTSGKTRNVCFASGARAVTETIIEDDCYRTTQTRVFRPDGSLCYTFKDQSDCLHGYEQETYSWLDPSGKLVASGNWNWDGTNIMCLNSFGACMSDERTSCAVTTAAFPSCPVGECP